MQIPPSVKFNRQVLFSVLTLVCLTVFIHLPIGHRQIPLQKNFEDFPAVIGQWEAQGFKGSVNVQEFNERSYGNETIPRLAGAYDHLAREYRDYAGHEIRLYTGYIEKQTEGRETIVDIRYYLGVPFEAWQIIGQGAKLPEIPGYSKSSFNVNRCIIQSGPEKQLILYWYQVGGRFIANKYWAKMSLVLNTIFKNRRDGAFICLSTPVTYTEDVSRENIVNFCKLAIPVLADYLPNGTVKDKMKITTKTQRTRGEQRAKSREQRARTSCS